MNRLRQAAHAILIIGVALIGFGAGLAIAPAPVDAIELLPCVQEDSPNCYWDSATMGNGSGNSFINIDGVYYYSQD